MPTAVTNFLWVMVGAGLGGGLRYAVQLGCLQWFGTQAFGAQWPYGTFFANVSGSFVIGLLAAWLTESSGPAGRLFWMTGVLGGYTTFSSFSLEAVQMWRGEARAAMLLYVAASVVACLVAAAVGLQAGMHLGGAVGGGRR